MINFDLKINKKDLEDLMDMDKDMLEGLTEGMERSMILVEKVVKNVYLSGRALKQRTGRLKKSIGTEVKRSRDKVTGTIGTLKYPVDYGPVWEYGGKYPATVISTIKAKALRFLSEGGAEVFAKSVKIPAHPIKARPYIMPAIEDNLKKLLSFLEEDATEKMNK